MAGVPDKPVPAEIKGQVQGEAKLDHAQITGEVSGTDTKDPHQLVPHLLGELHQFLVAELMQVGGRRYPG